MSTCALVLAAGKSTRIASLAQARPKPLLEVGGDTLLGWNLRLLARAGVRDVWINLHYRGADIEAAVGEGVRYGVSVRYSHEPELLGTAGAWKKVAATHNGTWLVVYGDNLTRLDVTALSAAHRPGTALAALFDADRHVNTGIYGGSAVVQDDRITGFVEGGAGTRLINAGIYVLDAALAADIPDGFADFGRDVFPRWASEGILRAHVLETGAFCLGLDTPEHFKLGEQLVSGGQVML